jgi:hypothetical protein
MKVITLQQPFASLYAKGLKKIETRSWNTKFRGKILIHASAGKKSINRHLLKMWQSSDLLINTNMNSIKFDDLPFEKIIGCVNIIDVETTENLLKNGIGKTNEFYFGDYSENRFGWLSDIAIEFQNPIPAKGQLSLWNFDLLEQHQLALDNNDKEALLFFNELNNLLNY